MTCGPGLICNRGVGVPQQEKGHYVEVLDEALRDYHIFRCRIPEVCPEGVLSLCQEPYAGRSCAVCGSDSVNVDHECDRCEAYVPIISCTAVLGFLFALYYSGAGTKYGKASQGTMIMSNLAILAASVQSVYITLSFFPELPSSSNWIKTTTQIFMFRFDAFAPSCNFGVSLGSRMAFGAMPPLLVVVGYAVLAPLMVALTKPLQRFGYPGLKIDILINTIGKLLQTLYVFLCKQAVAYLVVSEHPEPSPATLTEYSDVIVWSDEHLSMALLAVLVILVYVVGIYAVIAYAVACAPSKTADINFRNRWKFIFVRWRPHKWYWGLFLLLRNLCVALVPVVISSNAMHQVAAFTVVVSIYMLAEAQYLPWVSSTNNYVSVGMALLMILIAIGGLNTNPGEQPHFLGACYGLVWVLFFMGSFSVVVSALPRFRLKEKERYSRILHDLAGVSQGISSRIPEDCAKEDSLAWIDNVIKKLSDYDIRALSHTLDLMCHDVLQETFVTSIRSSNSFRVDSSGIEVPPARPSSFIEQSRDSMDSVWAQHNATKLESSDQVSPGAPLPRLLDSTSTSASPQDCSEDYCKV